MSIQIKSSLPRDEQQFTQLKDIFFSSSSVQTFSSTEARESFFQRWLGQYLQKFPEWTFLAILDDEVIGYLVAAPNCDKMYRELNIPGMDIFEAYYDRFSVGLHINVSFKARGQKVGEKLIDALKQKCLNLGKGGIHAITSAGARNVSFYSKLGFDFQVIQNFKGSDLLFMGCEFSKN